VISVKVALMALGMLATAGLLLAATLWVRDVHNDRKHTIKVNSPTIVFAGAGNEDCGGRQQAITVSAGSIFKVRRIRYWKNCATLGVVLSDGGDGYIVLDGRVTVVPPLL
jgi:hypothetical protein